MSGSLFPLYTSGAFGDEIVLFIQLLVGIGFGFALERSGFARSENLVSIFYGRDFRVMRVMFTAILTAMAGLVMLSGAGLMDMGLLYLNETFLWAQLVGGLVLGAGFVVSGYCPGTSLAGAASGRIDALFVIAGVPLGSWIYAELYPLLGAFANSASMGTASLPSWLGAPVWVVAVGVFLFAGGAFLAVGRIERWVRRRFVGTEVPAPGPAPIRINPLKSATHHLLFAAGLIGVVVLGAAYSARTVPADWGRYVGPDEHEHEGKVLPPLGAIELARILVEGSQEIAIIDIREGSKEASVPGSIFVSAGDLTERAAAHELPHVDAYVLVSGDGERVRELAPSLAAHGLYATWLDGGTRAWKKAILSPPRTPEGGVTKDQVALYEERASIHAYFTDAKTAPLKVKASPVLKVAPKKRKGGGCS
ncbi:MAG: YeeE/YedE family protein [Deltaproteobacteria bacterium]|nr:YeeE/YedE family protein [Deltaproteobacteria bacterium]